MQCEKMGITQSKGLVIFFEMNALVDRMHVELS